MATCPELPFKIAAEVLPAGVDLTDRLDGVTITGTPTITCSSTVIVVSAVAANAIATIINGTTVAVGKAILFMVAAGTAGTYVEFTGAAATTAGATITETMGMRVV